MATFRERMKHSWVALRGEKSSPASARLKAAPKGRVPFASTSNNPNYTGFGIGPYPFWGSGTDIDGYDTLLANGRVDYQTEVGLPSSNSIVAACLSWIITSWSNTTLQVGVMDGGKFVPDEQRHPLLDLMDKPHPDYGQGLLWAKMLTDWADYGNAYWNTVRDGIVGPPVELQFLDADVTTPYSDDPLRLVQGYNYRPNGQKIPLPAESVIHFRHYLPDPRNPRLGNPPLNAALREIYCDNMAAELTSAVLRKPRPSGILMPESSDVEVSSDDLDTIKRRAEELTSQQNAGGVLALSAGVKWVQLSFPPKDLVTEEARIKAEERICALFGIHPAVVNLGAGLERSTYSNMSEARKAAWQDCLIPLQDYIASVLTHRLLPMFPGSEGKVVAFDRSNVGVLQPDRTADRQSARDDLRAGIITLEEARAEGGRPPQPEMGTLPKPQEQQPQNANQQGQQSGQKAFKTAPMLEGRIYRAMSQFRAALSRDEEAAILELAAAYNRVDRALQDRLADVLDQLEAMPESEHLGFLSVRLNDLLAQVEGQLSDLSDRAAAIVESGQRATIETTTRHTPRIVRAAGGTNPFNALPTDAFENIVGMAGNGSPLASVLAEAAGAFVSEIRAELVSGVAQGINPQEVAARMVALSGGNRARLETICRTEMIRASREASRRTYAANSDIIDGYIRLSAADTRTCAACWALHGKLYPVDERMPLHPNCRCALVPHLKEGGVQVEEGASLFARLGEEQQKEILGPGRFDLWQSGASLSDFITLSNSPEWGPTVSVSPIAAASARAGVFS